MKMTLMMAGVLLVAAGCMTTDTTGSTAMQPVAGAPAIASAPGATSEASVAEGTGDVRCKHMPVMGSRVGKRVCRTEEEWAALEKQAKEIMSDLEANPLGRQENGG